MPVVQLGSGLQHNPRPASWLGMPPSPCSQATAPEAGSLAPPAPVTSGFEKLFVTLPPASRALLLPRARPHAPRYTARSVPHTKPLCRVVGTLAPPHALAATRPASVCMPWAACRAACAHSSADFPRSRSSEPSLGSAKRLGHGSPATCALPT